MKEADEYSVEEVVMQWKEGLEKLLENNPEIIIICDEVGCGVVPIDRMESCYREAVGRILCYLAQRAEGMERIISGIPVRIK